MRAQLPNQAARALALLNHHDVRAKRLLVASLGPWMGILSSFALVVLYARIDAGLAAAFPQFAANPGMNAYFIGPPLKPLIENGAIPAGVIFLTLWPISLADRRLLAGWKTMLTLLLAAIAVDFAIRPGVLVTSLLFYLFLLGTWAISVWMLYRSTSFLNKRWQRLIVCASQALCGYVLCLALMFWYVLGSGIDSL